ncbi:MAG: FG-GAP-like repeat-containing protein, partial [Mucilaginibacter sp.]
GYLSTIQNIAHFGTGKTKMLDSVVIRWQNGGKQVLKNVKTNQRLIANIADAKQPYAFKPPVVDKQLLFSDITQSLGITYKHRDYDYIDFTIQPLLLHKLSAYSPALAVGDVDGNGLDDIVAGGTTSFPAQMFMQQSNGKFIQRDLVPRAQINPNDNIKDEGLLLFDANGDGHPELYIASGGYIEKPGSSFYRDRLYINDGKGNFKQDAAALPVNVTSKFCVRAADYNKDGKLDLFVSGRVQPWRYPKPVSSFILRNDSRNGKAKFTDVTASVAGDLTNIGLISDALFTDFDNDGWPDLVLAGEWMPVTLLKNEHGVFKIITANSGIAGKTGWWNAIAAGDFDNDNDIDYIVGNAGLNTFFKADDTQPAYITAKDFDNNGSYDAFPSLFLKNKDGEMKEFPMHTRDDVIKQVLDMRRKFQNYEAFATATMDEVIPADRREGALRLKANTLQSCYMRNDGKGKFTMQALPLQAQLSQISGMSVDDFNGDGNLDVAINGNDFGTEVTAGRYDALNGLVLLGDGKGNFKPLSMLQSGIYIPGNGKAMVKLQGANNTYLMAASQHRGEVKVFKKNTASRFIKVNAADRYAILTHKNGKTSRCEFYYGDSFLSQSGRFICVGGAIRSVTIVDNDGHKRTITPENK